MPMGLAAIAVGVLLVWVPISHAILVDHRILVITTPGWSNVNFIKTVLTGYGTPYDVLEYTPGGGDPNGFLYKPDGSAKYSGVVLYPSVDAMGLMTVAQVKQLEAYQAAVGSRTVRWGAWPGYFGYNAAECSAGEADMMFTAAAPLGVSGIRPTARLPAGGLWRCSGALPAAYTTCNFWLPDGVVSHDCTTTSVLEVDAPSGRSVAGTLVNYDDGRQALVFMNDCAAWQPSCMLLGHWALSYLAKGVLPGQRRALLTAQVDDVFLSTDLYNDTMPKYRMTAADYAAHAAWTAAVNAQLPAGSNFKVDLAFNGAGILESYKDPAAMNVKSDYACNSDPLYTQLGCTGFTSSYATYQSSVPFCKNCTKDWKMPADPWGKDNVDPAYTSASWSAARVLKGDPLAAAASAGMLSGNSSFFWTSHTFTHQNLNNATSSDSTKQWQFNRDMAALLGFTPVAGLSIKGVVTPQISGLTNINNFKGMVANGYSAAVGDNTWPYLMNQAAPYWSLVSSQEVNGYDGFRIIPRWATEVYYNVATPKGEVALYNTLYRSFFGGDSTMDQILAREATRVVRDALLALRLDASMFHQANLATAGNTRSLLMMWVDAVLAKLDSWVAWPVESLSMDGLVSEFLNREQRDRCGLSYTLDIDPVNKAVQAIMINSMAGTGMCTAPLLIPATATLTGAGVSSGPPASEGARAHNVVLMAGGSTSVSTTGMPW